MKRAWLLRVVLRLVPRSWRETVAGDLEEEARRDGRAPAWVRGQVLRAALALTRSRMREALAVGSWRSDVRDALRSLRRAPIQTLTIVLSLTVGSTLAIVVAAVINAMLAGELPGVHDRGRLSVLTVSHADDPRPSGLLGADLLALPGEIPGLSAWGAEMPARRFPVAVVDRAGVARGSFVSGTYFSVLGTTPIVGRLIQPGDDRAGAPPVVALGHGFWQRYFNGRPDAVGRTIQISTGTFEVVGVTPPGFVGIVSSVSDLGRPTDERGEIWLPLAQAAPLGQGVGNSSRSGLTVIGRLAPALDHRAAEALAQGLTARFNAARAALGERYREPEHALVSTHLAPLRLLFFDADETAGIALAFVALGSVPLIVLCLACTNVAGVQLARAVGRTHELSVRTSLGAGRVRLARLLAVETGLLSVAAGILAWIAARELLHLASQVLPLAPLADDRVLSVAVLLPIGVTFLAGVLPAWRATGFDVLSGLRRGGGSGLAAAPALRRAVVAGQVGLSVALVATAGALAGGVADLDSAIGPRHDDVLVVDVQFGGLGFDEEDERLARGRIVERVRTLPGVESLGLSPRSIFLSSGGDGNCWPGGEPAGDWRTGVLTRVVSPTFFDVLRLPVLAGRTFHDGDVDVVVVNETFVQRLPDGASPLGAQVSLRSAAATIVGIVADSYERYPNGRPEPRCYVPWDDGRAGGAAMFIRTETAPALAPRIRAVLREVDPRLAPVEIGTIADLAAVHYRVLRGAITWVSVAAVIAVGLAAIGLFGVMSYGATLRTHEFGVRLALGARPKDIGAALLRESVGIAFAGAVVGLLLSAPLLWFLSGGLRSISWADPLAWTGTLSLILLVGLITAARPVILASRVNPLIVLRDG